MTQPMSRLKQRVKEGIRVTPGRLSANRQNALQSTGPKTATGKRASSVNALRHGLTSRVSFHGGSPGFSQIADLIDQEIGDRRVSEAIALKILEYERVVSAELAVAQKESRGEHGFRDEYAYARLEAEMMLATEIRNRGEENRKRKDLPKIDREEMKLFAEAGKFFQSVAIRQARDMDRSARNEEGALRRYFKRSSNQLIKAIRGAADPGRQGELD